MFQMFKPGIDTAVKLVLTATLFAGTTFSQQRLMPETAAAFDRFIERVEQSMDRRHDGGPVFLWLAEDQTRLDAAEAGDLVIERLDGDAGLDDAMIHNWIGGMFIPDVTIDDVLTVFLDYDKYPDIYPGVIESRLLGGDGNSNSIYQRFAPRGYRAGHVARGRLSNARWKAGSRLVQVHRDSGSPERGGIQ